MAGRKRRQSGKGKVSEKGKISVQGGKGQHRRKGEEGNTRWKQGRRSKEGGKTNLKHPKNSQIILRRLPALIIKHILLKDDDQNPGTKPQMSVSFSQEKREEKK